MGRAAGGGIGSAEDAGSPPSIPEKKAKTRKPKYVPGNPYGPHFRPHAILSRDELDEAVGSLLRSDEFVFDVETVGTHPPRYKGDKPALDFESNSVIWISLGGPGQAYAIPCGHPTGPKQLSRSAVFEALEPLFFSERRKVNQNVMFDLLTVAKYYDDEIPPPPYGDTMVLAHLLNENMTKLGGFNLRNLCIWHFAVEWEKNGKPIELIPYRKLAQEGEPMDRYSFQDVAQYSFMDAKMTWLLWRDLCRKAAKPRLERMRAVFDMEMDLLEVLLRMRVRGVLVDRLSLERMRDDLEDKIAVLEQEIYDLAGKRFLLTSPDQWANLLYNELGLHCYLRTKKTGKPSTAAEALKPLRRRHPIIPKKFEYEDHRKIYSVYVKGMIPHIYPDGRIRCLLKQTGTVTGRFSSANPNLQNIPRASQEGPGAAIRTTFVAKEGYVLVVGDYSQIELRLVAHFCCDRNMLRAYREGLDLHMMTSEGIFGRPAERITKEERTLGKNSNFNFCYGGGFRRVMEMTDCTEEVARRAYKGYHRKYPGVKRWHEQVKKRVHEMLKNRQMPYVETILGRKHRIIEFFAQPYLRVVHSDPGMIAYAERQAINAIIQGSAADICKMAMVRMDRRIERTGKRNSWFLTLTVHDELIMEVPQDDAEEAVALMREAMEGVKVDLRVPLVADVHYAKRWSDAK